MNGTPIATAAGERSNVISVLALLMLGSLAALVVGLVAPRLVLPDGWRTRRRVLLVYGLGTIFALFAVAVSAPQPTTRSADSKQDGQTVAAASESSGSSAGNSDRRYRSGQQADVGYMTYQVNGAWFSKRLSDNRYLDQPPDATYLFIDLAVRNNDKQERAIPPFKLVDEQDAEYGTSDKAWAAEGSIGALANLNPRVARRAFVIFDVPPDRRYALKVSGGFWSSESALIDIEPTKSDR